MKKLLYLLLVLNALYSCEEPEIKTAETRSFYMGFQPWPHDISQSAIMHAYDNINKYGDIISMQLDNGIPWNEALTEADFPTDFQSDINNRKQLTPSGTKVFLSLMPLSEGRNGIAHYWGDNSETENKVWQNKRFTDNDIITAYINYCHRMIEFFEPAYFCYAVEANASFSVNDQVYKDFLVFCDTVYKTLKTEYPNMPIMLSLVTNFLGGDIVEGTTEQLLVYSDYVAMSSYPFLLPSKPVGNADPQQIPANWFTRMPKLAPNKPVCITETAYIAENLELPAYHIDLKGREEWQAAYVNDLLKKMNDLNAEFVIWFTARDYDYAGQKLEGIVDPAYYIWMDTGLLNGDGLPRQSLKFWEEWFHLSVQ